MNSFIACSLITLFNSVGPNQRYQGNFNQLLIFTIIEEMLQIQDPRGMVAL